MYIKVNEVVTIDGNDYKAIEQKCKNRCNGCDLFLTFECSTIKNMCYSLNREDKKNIVFLKVSKKLT